MKNIISAILYFCFGLVASLALFGFVQAAWNTPVTSGVTFLSQAVWNDRDQKITELENRMNAIHNLIPGSVCGVYHGGRDQCPTVYRECRPADPPPGLNQVGGDLYNPDNCRFVFYGI